MSASEKLRALDEALDAYGWQIGWDSGEVYFSGGDPPIAALANALPQIVAVMEAAERYFAQLDADAEGKAQLDHLLPWRRRELELRDALAALDEALS